jgi:hypothetical protein
VEEQRVTIAELKSTVGQQKKEFQVAIAEQRKELEARLKQQDAKLQRVSDRIELGRSAPQTAGNDP